MAQEDAAQEEPVSPSPRGIMGRTLPRRLYSFRVKEDIRDNVKESGSVEASREKSGETQSEKSRTAEDMSVEAWNEDSVSADVKAGVERPMLVEELDGLQRDDRCTFPAMTQEERG
ncbi:hypothetical protein NDU88_003424 [Pleurodeles waltl]|uniref:Uncharacterized protein n=1 Tax=Pleurodeles waltl TaxID=8319 RepID=A0AAV7VHA9_PLEWA|nr:hypothetical protein NDU88_003424 [Pleurodeles waltl]